MQVSIIKAQAYILSVARAKSASMYRRLSLDW